MNHQTPPRLPEWLDSVHCELNEDYIQPCYPRLGEQVTVKVRFWKDAPVRRVFFKTLINGADSGFEMKPSFTGELFVWYEHTFIITQPSVAFNFILETSEAYYFVTRRRVTTWHQTEDFDWVILADFDQPAWVPGAVFYQIFPDRFARGNTNQGVKDGEYKFDGALTRALEWHDRPLAWSRGHCLDFFNGDLEGVRRRIAYLKDLGVTALFLNPIFEGSSTHRYDCNDYFHVDRHLGGNGALARLTEALHAEGMRIILDVSLNHIGSEHHWLKKAMADPSSEEAGYFYRGRNGEIGTWMGVPTLPQLNYNSKSLRKVIYKGKKSLVRTWLRAPYNIDGWRFDVGHMTGNRGRDILGSQIFRGVRKASKAENPQAWLIGEHWQDNISHLTGDEWDGAMNYFASARPIRRFMGELDRFVFNQNHAINFKPGTGWDLEEQILQHFARLPNPVVFLQMNLIDSHDIHRLHNNSEIFRFDLYRGAVFLLFLLPGAPSIYYGDEVGLDGWIEDIEGCRFPMQWDQKKWKQEFVQLYGTMAKLKRDHKALHSGGFRVLYADETSFVFARFLGSEVVFCVFNRSPENKTVTFDARVLGLTAAVEIFTGAAARIEGGQVVLPLLPFENQVFRGESSL